MIEVICSSGMDQVVVTQEPDVVSRIKKAKHTKEMPLNFRCLCDVHSRQQSASMCLVMLLDLALQGEVRFGRAISSHGTPMSLISSDTTLADRSWLPWLVEGLEVECIDAPVDNTAAKE